jgi:ubiquitin fusion degradation protein 1
MMFFGGKFSEHFRAYPMSHISNYKDRKSINYGSKILLPQSALAKLTSLHIEYPMFFSISYLDKVTHGGVLEFTAPEGKMYLPDWMMEQLSIQTPGVIAKVDYESLPLGTFLKIQPQSKTFLDISDPKAVLERALRNYSTLTQGDIIAIEYNGQVHRLGCVEVKPLTNANHGISIIETDLSVDFAPPLDYEEPVYTPKTAGHHRPSLDIEQHKVVDKKEAFQSFVGGGQRLSGKSLDAPTPLQYAPKSTEDESVAVKKVEEQENVPEALRLPSNKLWFGYDVKPYVEPKNDGDKEVEKEEAKFKGAGISLRKAK